MTDDDVQKFPKFIINMPNLCSIMCSIIKLIKYPLGINHVSFYTDKYTCMYKGTSTSHNLQT